MTGIFLFDLVFRPDGGWRCVMVQWVDVNLIWTGMYVCGPGVSLRLL